jgi:TetR/AcrR family transcriptional regulator
VTDRVPAVDQAPPGEAPTTWAERAADRSPMVQRSKTRGVEQAKAIVGAARRLIDIKGPTFTTQELIKEARIALQTFYRYFPGKDHLLLAVIEDVIAENCNLYREAARALADPLDRLRFYVSSTMESLGGPRHGPSFITSEHWRLQTIYPDEVSRATQPFTDLLIVEIREASATGRLAPNDPEYSAWLITQLVMAVFHHYDCAGLDQPVDQVADSLWRFCLSALGGERPAAARPPAPRAPARNRQRSSRS